MRNESRALDLPREWCGRGAWRFADDSPGAHLRVTAHPDRAARTVRVLLTQW